MLDSVTETIITGVLHVDVNHESQPSLINTKIRLPHGLGLTAILTLACGLFHIPVFGPCALLGSQAFCRYPLPPPNCQRYFHDQSA